MSEIRRKSRGNAVIVQFIVVALFIQTGTAIECFICESTSNPACATLKSNSGLKPEECSPEKMNRLHSWLADLSRISYFNDRADQHKVPMTCQKVVGSKDNEEEVTARFCQIYAGETHPCTIPVDRLKSNKSVKIEHCSTCGDDRCNDANSIQLMSGFQIAALLLLVFRTIL